MCTDYAPSDDPVIQCDVRLWQGESVTVFIHPREWKRVVMNLGVPMVISSCGITFPCLVGNPGEHYSVGMVEIVRPQDFGVPTHGDYAGTARIDWPEAIPELLRMGLDGSPDLLAAWRSLSCQQMRAHISYVRRARRPGVIAERQLAILRLLAG